MINHNSSTSLKDIIVMFIIMIIASIITGMNMWVNSLDDVRLQLNDVYMGISMTGWMFLLMGIFYSITNIIWIGLVTIIISAYLIRNQVFINEDEYLSSMIPHHSMAIFMSKKLKEKDVITNNVITNNVITNNVIDDLVNNIILTQQEEIDIMKKY